MIELDISFEYVQKHNHPLSSHTGTILVACKSNELKLGLTMRPNIYHVLERVLNLLIQKHPRFSSYETMSAEVFLLNASQSS